MGISTCPNLIDLMDYLKQRLNMKDEGVILQSLEKEDIKKVEESDFESVLILFRRTYEKTVNVNERVYEVAEENCEDIYKKFCGENKRSCKEVLNWCNEMRKKAWKEGGKELLSTLSSDEKEIENVHQILRDMYDFASKYAHGNTEVIEECSYLIDKFKSAIYFLKYLSSLKTGK